jgi:hypothetical protein
LCSKESPLSGGNQFKVLFEKLEELKTESQFEEGLSAEELEDFDELRRFALEIEESEVVTYTGV